MARLSVGEALTNFVWAPVSSLNEIKCSANWMWAAKLPGEACGMYDACESMRDLMLALGVSVDGGKDSLSMSTQIKKESVKAPGTLVITLYGACSDVEKIVTPDLKPVEHSVLLYVDCSGARKSRCGGSALAQVYGQLGNESPDVDDPEVLRQAFITTQKCIQEELILAGHDRSDGGLLVTLVEMAFAGNCGMNINFGDLAHKQERDSSSIDPALAFCFAEELGLVLQVEDLATATSVQRMYAAVNVPCNVIGHILPHSKHITVTASDTGAKEQVLLSADLCDLRDTWEATGFEIEKYQTNPECVSQEQTRMRHRKNSPQWTCSGFSPKPTPPAWLLATTKPRIAVLREEGSNGDREMQSAFYAAGFEVWDMTMTDLVAGHVSLDERFQGLACVGGFSFADVMGSAKGWAGQVKFHPRIQAMFEHFRTRQDTFSLGVCNGCQLMSLLGWVTPECRPSDDENSRDSENDPRFIENQSGRYESRFVNVQIQDSPSILLSEMAGSSFGVWIAHGEGQVHFPQDSMRRHVLEENLAPIRYVDDTNAITTHYPDNPNGSAAGIAALCSRDGRHLCMMPHPERCFLKWQWPWMPQEWKLELEASPWMKMFQNAKLFCDQFQQA